MCVYTCASVILQRSNHSDNLQFCVPLFFLSDFFHIALFYIFLGFSNQPELSPSLLCMLFHLISVPVSLSSVLYLQSKILSLKCRSFTMRYSQFMPAPVGESPHHLLRLIYTSASCRRHRLHHCAPPHQNPMWSSKKL